MSVTGITQTVLATQLAEAFIKDRSAGISPITADGIKDGAVAEWIRSVAGVLSRLSEEGTPVAEVEESDAGHAGFQDALLELVDAHLEIQQAWQKDPRPFTPRETTTRMKLARVAFDQSLTQLLPKITP